VSSSGHTDGAGTKLFTANSGNYYSQGVDTATIIVAATETVTIEVAATETATIEVAAKETATIEVATTETATIEVSATETTIIKVAVTIEVVDEKEDNSTVCPVELAK